MKKTIKILSLVLGGLLLLIVAAAIIVPLVVDVDKFRPDIVKAANEKINGKLELGKLKLSLWGQIRVDVGGLSLADNSGRKVVSVKDAFIHVPFASMFSGAPELVFKMDHPEVLVIKNKAGKLNVMSLMKPAEVPAGGTPSGATPPSGKPSGNATAEAPQIPGFVALARVGVELRNALLTYKDEATGLSSVVKDFNLVMRDISLSRTSKIELWADLDTTMGKTLSVKGPARLTANAKPELVNNAFDRLILDAKIDLDGLEISAGGAFEKKKGVAANADIAVQASEKEAKIDKMNFKFFNAEIKSSGAITQLGAQPATPGGYVPPPNVNFVMSSNEIDLKPWNELIPMLKAYELGGTAKLDAKAKGPSDKLLYEAKFAIKGLTAKAGDLKAQPRFDVAINILTDQIESLLVTMKAPGNEMQLKGKMASFTKPQVNLELTSSGMDLDQLINWPPPPPAGAATAAAPVASGGDAPAVGGAAKSSATAAKGGASAAAEDTDALLEPLRSNPAAAGAAAVMNFNIKMLKAKGIAMNDMVGKLYFRDLTAGLDGFAFKMWNGVVKANFASNLKPKTPTYTFSTAVEHMDLREAVKANVAMFKNTVVGVAHFELGGQGASFNSEAAKSNLKAKGKMAVKDATFGTIDVGKMASEAVNKGIERVAEKVPQAKGKSVGMPGGKESKYELISSTFTIENGHFKAPDFATKAAPNNGIDLKGDTDVGLKDFALKTRWEVIDTFNLLKARDISVEQAGVKVDHILAEGNGPVKFVVSAGCTCLAPCYSYTEVPEYLAKVALNNVAAAVGAKAKAEVQNKIQQVIPKSAPPAVQKTVEDLGKKFFH